MILFMKLWVTLTTALHFSGKLCNFQERAPSQWRKCRWHRPDPELRDLRRPCDGEALRRRLLRRLQGVLQALRAQGARVPGKYATAGIQSDNPWDLTVWPDCHSKPIHFTKKDYPKCHCSLKRYYYYLYTTHNKAEN